MGERRGAYGVSVGKPEGNSLLGRSRLRWEDNMKVCVLEVGWVHMDWIDLPHHRTSGGLF